MAAELPSSVTLFGFAPGGWGPAMLQAAGMTLAVSIAGYAVGLVFGALAAAGQLSRFRPLRGIADAYTTVLRGIPELLVIYLFYFGGSSGWGRGASVRRTGVRRRAGFRGRRPRGRHRGGGLPGRDHARRLPGLGAGQDEAARSLGLSGWLTFRLVLAPQALAASPCPGWATSGSWCSRIRADLAHRPRRTDP